MACLAGLHVDFTYFTNLVRKPLLQGDPLWGMKAPAWQEVLDLSFNFMLVVTGLNTGKLEVCATTDQSSFETSVLHWLLDSTYVENLSKLQPPMGIVICVVWMSVAAYILERLCHMANDARLLGTQIVCIHIDSAMLAF